MNQTKPDDRSVINCDFVQRNSSSEDVLWTDKYGPQRSNEVIGNSVSVNKLHSWLKKWKRRADCDEKRTMQERKQEENSSESWDCGDFQGEAGSEDGGEEMLCNAMLITGPSGVGKTASVYACAQELGFKVFEVNCSSQRSGRNVLSQLKEATQSHLVEPSGKDPLKPAYFNNYSTKNFPPKTEKAPGKSVAPRNVISSSKKRPARKLCRFGEKGKGNPATVTLANYFKMKATADHFHLGGQSPSEKPDGMKSGNLTSKSDQTVWQNKKTSTSLILFEEVDVIFADDVGFLAAVKTFMATTKRPVVLTTNDPTFRERFSCTLEEIVFKTPSALHVCSYLQLVCLAENVKLDLHDAASLFTLTRGDIRRCLLQLQFWVKSIQDFQLPSPDICCTASMLGLHPVTRNHLLTLLKSWTEPDTNQLLKLLAESWRREVPLLYSNLELLLPIGTQTSPALEEVASSELQRELAPSDVQMSATAMKSDSVRNVSRLSRKKNTAAGVAPSSLTSRPQRPSLTQLRAPNSDGKTDLSAAKAAADCLDALSNFFDLMSHIDSTVPATEFPVTGSCRREEFVWTGAELKDSLLDEMREEEVRSCNQERLLDIQAAVEGLGCHSCWGRVSEVWTGAQRCRQRLGEVSWTRLVETLTFSNRKSLIFSSQPLSAPSVSQRRYELSRAVLSSRCFSLQGNRQAVTVDYMPVLRAISRSQRQKRDEPVRCGDYLSSLHMGLSKSTIQHLAEDFPDNSCLTSNPHNHIKYL
ncbi:ATPase family AAA domain-containing protein 5b [Aulostomus maculatus]